MAYFTRRDQCLAGSDRLAGDTERAAISERGKIDDIKLVMASTA